MQISKLALLGVCVGFSPSLLAQNGVEYFQRGVGPTEAFSEMFGLGGNYGREMGRTGGNNCKPKPVHPYGSGSSPNYIDFNDRSEFGPFNESQRNLRYYSQTGNSGYNDFMKYGEYNPDVRIVIEQPGRGTIMTYGPDSATDKVYMGNIREKVNFLGEDRKLWGATPDFPEGQFPDGSQSVLLRDHPAMQNWPKSFEPPKAGCGKNCASDMIKKSMKRARGTIPKVGGLAGLGPGPGVIAQGAVTIAMDGQRGQRDLQARLLSAWKNTRSVRGRADITNLSRSWGIEINADNFQSEWNKFKSGGSAGDFLAAPFSNTFERCHGTDPDRYMDVNGLQPYQPSSYP